MSLWSPEVLDADGMLDQRLAAVPDRPAVFRIHTREGRPYLGRTVVLQRRLLRLLGPRRRLSRLINLREVAERIEYRLTASWLETNLVFYEIVRASYPEDYRSVFKLRMPHYLKVGLANAFPRCYLTTRISSSPAVWYGPFRTRAAAEAFESQFAGLFQLRRCQDDLEPSPEHPGCIYGEMNMCLRPCQQLVGPEEYSNEVKRATGFLATDGRSHMEAVLRARDSLSNEMQFEEAARLHKQAEKIQQTLRQRDDDIVRDIDRLCGVAVTPSVTEGCVDLWHMLRGSWLPPVRFRVAAEGGEALSLDQRLREAAGRLIEPKTSARERQDHLALLARWYYASFRDGEWLSFGDLADLPYRKLVRAISRVAAGAGSLHHDGSHVFRGRLDHQSA